MCEQQCSDRHPHNTVWTTIFFILLFFFSLIVVVGVVVVAVVVIVVVVLLYYLFVVHKRTFANQIKECNLNFLCDVRFFSLFSLVRVIQFRKETFLSGHTVRCVCLIRCFDGVLSYFSYHIACNVSCYRIHTNFHSAKNQRFSLSIPFCRTRIETCI